MAGVAKDGCRLAHESPADSLSLQLKADVQVVQQGTPLGVGVETGMGEADHFAVTVGDDREASSSGR